MKNISRVLLKKRSKQNDRRKNSSVSSVPDNITSPSCGQLTASLSATSGWKPQESPTHHIVHVQTPPRRENGPSYTNHTQEAWTVKTNVPSNSINSPSTVGLIPKVNIGFSDDAQTPRYREDVISITKDVQRFLATITELRQAMEEMDAQKPEFIVRILDNDQEDSNIVNVDHDNKEEIIDAETEEYYRSQDKVIEKLRELVQVVEICLESNPGMQSTDLTRTSKHLLTTYENCNHDMGKVSECIPCNNAIDSLVDTFTQNVSDYMIGETSDPAGGITTLGSVGGVKAKPQSLGIPQLKGPASSKSHDNLARFSSSVDLTQANEPIVDIIDQDLLTVENNVEVASGYIKFRQKYARELAGYLNKRAQLEQRHYAQLAKIVRQTQTALTELHQQEECLPLIDVLRKSLDDDSHYAMNSNTTFNLQVGHKILEPLEHKILESEKMRKDLMHNWQRERKKLAEAKALMKNTKAKYHFYGSEISRVKNLLAAEPFGKQADRKKKEISELEGKFQEAEQAFKDAVAHCNDCQYQVHATAQKSILCAFRRIIIGFDTALKAGLENYFQLQYNFFKSLPDPLVINLEEAQDYEIGSEFLSFIQRQKRVCDELEDYHFEEFDPEAENLWDNAEEGGPDSSISATTLFSTSADNKSPHERTLSPTWDIKGAFLRNETPSPKPSQKTRPKSIAILDINPITDSPKTNLQRRNSEKKDLGTIASITVSPYSSTNRNNNTEDTVYSRMAKTHGFRKLRTPSRCKGCDTYVYFHGFECETCGLACHRKCLATLAIRCGTKKLPRKMNTFGVDFHEHLKATKRHIPIIVTKCINEIDERGLDTQGLYRISSAKSKMEKLCQLFEAGSERVDLSDLPPHLISSCLKLYFRQLPEPLLTFGLYQEFLTFAREASSVLPCKLDKLNKEQYEKASTLLRRLEELIHHLPESNQLTLARLMYHLHRVSSPEHVRVNCMPPSNIGIVFGPNLLRQQEMLPSLELLANMSYQAKVVEIMTTHALDIFHIPEDEIKQFELECSEEDDMEAINERLVDEEEYQESSIDIDDDEESKSNVVYNRTPMSTPPERRKMNVEELHEMLEEFGSGQCCFLTPPHPKSVPQPIPFHASPLLHDSRNWQDHSGSEILPGSTTDVEGFAESVFNSIDRRLLHPYHAVSVPAMEKILTPVMEKEDYATDEEFDDPIMYSASNTLDYHHHTRRRAQSLTKSSSVGFNEDDDKGESDGVFHSRTPSNVSDASHRPYLGSRSEDNLLQIDNLDSPVVKETQRLSFESNILKYVQEENDKRQSTESLDSQEYKPFQSPDVQALLLPSSTASSPGYFPRSAEGKPVQSLPRNFHRPPVPSLPLRQMSEGYIKPVKSPHFSIGSPPLASPVSLISADKSGSSQGSFSEHFLYDSAEVDEQRMGKKEVMLKRTRGERKVEYEGRDKSSQLVIRYQRGREKPADSGTEDPPNFNSVASVEEEDIPLPDNSPMMGVAKFPPTHRFSTSRDSGLSDSPDPFVEIASPTHTLSSIVLVDKLSQIAKDQTKHPSPLIKEQKPTAKKDDTLTNNRAPFVKSQSTAVSPKTRVTHHIMKVMKASSLDFDPSSAFQFSENESALPEQRLRMVSPDRLISPTDYPTDVWNMKRSKSLAEGTAFARNSEEREEEHTRMGELIISEAKIGQQKISSQGLKKGMNRDLSKSLEILR